jgi:hypothetical protein
MTTSVKLVPHGTHNFLNAAALGYVVRADQTNFHVSRHYTI